MPAIITDQFRILNAETFTKSVTGIGTTSNFYYTFLAHPNPTNVSIVDYGDADWTTSVPDPRDSFQQEDRYADSMLFLKKIGINDFARIIPRVNWSSGITYDMYKNNYDIINDAPQTSAKTLYESRFYVVNSEFKVYICINNGSSPDFVDGRPSQFEPTFVDTAPQQAGDGSDGYLWKYLYTIAPADIVKFTTEKYMPVPPNWGDVNTAAVKDAAVRGHVETVVIKNRGTGYTTGTNTFSDIDILGDGTGGKVSITVNDQEVESIEVTDGGKDYTKGLINFTSGGGSGAEFEVIIPPKGGHGADIYRELGTYRVMIYSKYDTAADFAAQNNFSRIGIVRNPNEFGSSTSILNKNTATSLGALKLTGAGNTSDTIYKLNAEIRQSVGTAGSFAVGYVASWDRDTGVLRYYQPVGFTTLTGNNFKNVDFESNGNVINTSPSTDVEGSPLQPDTTFNGSSVTLSNKVVDLGQTFAGGKANPEVEKFSGDIIYIDNRAPVGRSESQKEEVKIVVEF